MWIVAGTDGVTVAFRTSRRRYASNRRLGVTRTGAKDHAADGYTRYIIGKHIPDDGGRISSFNPVDDAEFGSRIRTIVRAGDVICTTRGPKLKVAVAEFDCLSAHTNFIMRPKDPNLVLPGILEGIVRSDGFQDHLRKHFRGSTNLFVNWSDAAQYEFALPPLEEQLRVANLLRAATDAVEASRNAAQLAQATRKAFLTSVFRPHRGNSDQYPRHWRVVSVDEAGEVQLGQKRDPSVHHGANMRQYLRVANVLDDDFDLSDVLSMHFGERELPKYLLRDGDILLNEGQSPDLLGRSAIWREQVPSMYFQMTLLRFRAGPDVLPEFAHAFFQHMLYTRQFAKGALQTTSIAHLSASKFGQMLMPVPPLSDQRALLLDYDRLRLAGKVCKERFQAQQSIALTLAREALDQ